MASHQLDELERLHRPCGCARLCGRYTRGGCAVTLPAHAAICIDCDNCTAFGADQRKPDVIVLWPGSHGARDRWLVVEMKARGTDAGGITRQLQAGADAITAHPLFDIGGQPAEILPIVLHAKGFNTTAADALAANRIRFRGEPIPIVVKRCGFRLR